MKRPDWLDNFCSWIKCKQFLKHYFIGLYERVGRHHDFLMAGGLAFSLFVCIVPFVLIVFAILGRVLEIPVVSEEIKAFIDSVIPYPDAAQTVQDVVFERVREFRGSKNIAGILGILGLLWAASRLFSSMRTILNWVYKTPPGSIFTGVIGKLRDFGMVLLVMSYFLLSTTILPALEILRKFANQSAVFSFFGIGFMGDLVVNLITYLIIYSAFWIMYYLVPQAKIPVRVAVVSSIWAAILWKVAEVLFRWYITNAVTLKAIYGAYILAIVVVFWIYYISLVFIVGAEIGQLYRERRAERQRAREG